jgi:hypothetical protein
MKRHKLKSGRVRAFDGAGKSPQTNGVAKRRTKGRHHSG